jgi:diguanylate cyclase (GGDEF)-like protein/PAS domain S-box-containing protein
MSHHPDGGDQAGPGMTPGVTGLSPDAEADMFRSISVASPNAVIAADADGVMVWANAAAERMFGWPLDELVGTALPWLVTEEFREPAYAVRRRALAGETVGPQVMEGRRRNGETFTMSVAPAIRRDRGGRVLGVSVIIADTTGHLQVQRELTAALARSRARFDQVGMPQALLDLDARIVSVNDALCELLRWPREKLVGRSGTDLVLPTGPEPDETRFDRLRQGLVASTTAEVLALRGDGSHVPLLVDLSAVGDAEGRPCEVALFARDLTEVREAQRRLESQDAFFRALQERASDLVIVTDEEARITYVSPSVTNLLGYRREQVLGRELRDFVVEDDLERSQDHRSHLLTMPSGARSRRLARARDASGAVRWLDGVTTHCLDDPDIRGLVTNLRDVTAEIEAQEALRTSEARFRAIAETAQEGILAVDPDGSLIFANQTTSAILGIPLEGLYETDIRTLLRGDESSRLTDRLARRGQLGPEHYELPYQHPDGSERVLFVAASPLTYDDGTPMGSLGMISDVTTARAVEAELRHRALHDTLTGLPNRALLVDRLTVAGAAARRGHGRGLAVLFLDLDHFKLVNDSRGHDAGDRLLVDVAARLQLAVRESDTVARLGGDEFAVVCQDAGQADADGVAARIQEQLATPFDVDGEQVYISASIGIALSPPYAVGDLLRFADAAMYDAKDQGRSQVTTFDGTDSLGSERRLAITGALREALDAGTLTLGYQAIVDLDSREVVGLEALLRWEHPTLGPVPPEEVVHAAEASGLSFDLDLAVLETAMADLARLRKDGVVPATAYVSVNISPRSTQQRPLDVAVGDLLARAGLPGSALFLEITEHAVMGNADQAVDLLDRLGDLGVGVTIDDFGTGYNSLVHLQRLPIDVLKIDRSFVRDIVGRADSLAIARSIVGLASAIGLATVAEGIEDEEQLRILQDLGCQAGQGFLWGRAVRAQDVAGSLPTPR